jgi:hypothetical protein
VYDTGHIFGFAANPVGVTNEAPFATISGGNTLMNASDFDGLAVDSSGTIYQGDSTANIVAVFASNPAGTLNEAPIATISGPGSGLSNPRGIAVR